MQSRCCCVWPRTLSQRAGCALVPVLEVEVTVDLDVLSAREGRCLKLFLGVDT